MTTCPARDVVAEHQQELNGNIYVFKKKRYKILKIKSKLIIFTMIMVIAHL